MSNMMWIAIWKCEKLATCELNTKFFINFIAFIAH